MSSAFKDSRVDDWTSWIGQPMLYDGGLFVNRTLEEHEENNKHIISWVKYE